MLYKRYGSVDFWTTKGVQWATGVGLSGWHAFDFRGVSKRTINGRLGTLADSNERGSARFAPTFVAELIWGKVRVAKFKLDWIL